MNQQLRSKLQMLNSRVRRLYGLPKSFKKVEVCANPIFVIGSYRSGTTFFGWSLSHHSWLWTSGESTLITEIFDQAGVESVERARERAVKTGEGSWLYDQDVEQRELLAHLGTGINALYTSRSRGRRWVEHTPGHTLLVDVIADLFPRAVFLHLLRDGRQVVHSMTNFANALSDERRRTLERADWSMPWPDFETACATWRDSVETAMRFASFEPNRCLTVLHSRLVSEPWRAYRDVFRFLGIPFEQGPIGFCRATRINSSFPGAEPRTYSNPWPDWSKEQRRTFVRVAGRTLVRCGLATWDELEFETYDELVERVRQVGCSEAPSEATVLVASGGDERLVALKGRNAWHFPRSQDGHHSGHHPGDGAEAVRHLEELRVRGGEFLLFPRTSLWWLDHYKEMQSHLDERYERVVDDPSTCVMFALNGFSKEPAH